MTQPAPVIPPSSGEPIYTADLDRAVVRGNAWTGAMKWGNQILS